MRQDLKQLFHNIACVLLCSSACLSGPLLLPPYSLLHIHLTGHTLNIKGHIFVLLRTALLSPHREPTLAATKNPLDKSVSPALYRVLHRNNVT